MAGPKPAAFLIFSGFNLRAVVALCRALTLDGRNFHIIACTSADGIFYTSWRKAVVATRTSAPLAWADVEHCIRTATSKTGISSWSIAPTSEYLIRWCFGHRAAIAALGCSLPLPDSGTYLRVSDKRLFIDHCRDLGLAVPAEASDFEAVGLPCVAKPTVNVTPDGRSLYPWLLRTAGDLSRFRADATPGEHFFQSWVYGESIYLLLHLASDGRTVRFSQKNLAQQPGGKSIVLAEAADFHRSAAANAWELALRRLGFSGLAMIELRLTTNGTAVLIEANPRLWGPLQLVVDHSPALLHAYFDEVLGPRVRSAALPHPGNSPQRYLWYGGARDTWKAGGSLDWLVPRPRWPHAHLVRSIGSDVYLRRDSWRYFAREWDCDPINSDIAR